MVWFSIAAFIGVVFLIRLLYRRFASDGIEKINERRRTTSRLVSRGEFIDGNRHLAVGMAVTHSTLFYENSDMEASLDLQFVREIEYDTELATGTAPHGGKVLRLRSDSQTFEFVIPNESVAAWHMNLPPRRVAKPRRATAGAR